MRRSGLPNRSYVRFNRSDHPDQRMNDVLIWFCRVKSSWLDYVNPRPPGLTPKDHLETYRQQLELARILDPVKINAHSGA